MTVQYIIEQELVRFTDFIISEIKKELKAQGHYASGKSFEQISGLVEANINGLVKAYVLVPEHLLILDKGVKPSRVPFSRSRRRRGRGGSSKYIGALIDWLKIVEPSLSAKERKGRAFAIAYTAKAEGHPTQGSYRFSSNGRRKDWTKYAIDENVDRATEIINYGRIVEAIISDGLDIYQSATV